MPRSRVSSNDREIAARLRWVRAVLGRTRRELAEVLGVSIQQVMHYEVGRSRISAGQLVAVARALNVPIGRLFGEDIAALPVSNTDVTAKLIRNFNALDPAAQNDVLKLIRTLARTGEEKAERP